MALKVKRFLTDVNASNLYVCWCTESGQGAIVDPSEYNSDIEGFISDRGIRINSIFITHGHYDHDSALEAVRAKFPVLVYSAKAYQGVSLVTHGDEISLGKEKIRVVKTCGHTEDSVSYISRKVAFVGDAVFAAAVGGTSNRSNFEREVDAIRSNLFSLPDSTTLYPGHGPATTVSVERIYNPFFF